MQNKNTKVSFSITWRNLILKHLIRNNSEYIYIYKLIFLVFMDSNIVSLLMICDFIVITHRVS